MTVTLIGFTYEVYTEQEVQVNLLENLYPPDSVILVDPSEIEPIISDAGNLDLGTAEDIEDLDGGDLDAGVAIAIIDPDAGDFDTGLPVLSPDAWLGSENSPGTTIPGVIYDPEIEFGTVLVDADNVPISVEELPDVQGDFVPQISLDFESRYKLRIGFGLNVSFKFIVFSYGSFEFKDGFSLDFGTVNEPLAIQADFGSITEESIPVLPSGIY